MNNQNFSDDRQTFKGDWTCAQCGAKITELPFKPDKDRPLYCRDCYRKTRQNSSRRF